METIILENKVFELVNCSKCNEVKHRFKSEIRLSNRCYACYDEKGNRWQGKICPVCIKTVYKKQNKGKKFPEFKNCIICYKSFMSPKTRKYCSRKCYMKCEKIKIYKQKYKKTDNAKKLAKEIKRLRKRQVKQAKLKSTSWSKIEKVYCGCPSGFQVDHIIPINHSLVCGLHVPWNMQYLTPKENNLKSNNFDGTKENNSWRIKI